MKYEWRKQERTIYLPKTKPEVIKVPEYKYLVIDGQGNPNSAAFGAYIEALYSVSYAIKMTLKKMDNPPKGYCDYTVYPLEGIWDITEEAQKTFTGTINKDDLVFRLMIRQPGFVSHEFFEEMLAMTQKKKPQELLSTIQYETIEDGDCIQMMHIGSYDDEPASFQKMEVYAIEKGLTRISKRHREIYLSDFRKVPKEKLKTVLRFQVR